MPSVSLPSFSIPPSGAFVEEKHSVSGHFSSSQAESRCQITISRGDEKKRAAAAKVGQRWARRHPTELRRCAWELFFGEIFFLKGRKSQQKEHEIAVFPLVLPR
ncbi:MAG: hypothetical protein LUD84_03670 [Clostridiales bacterium]|nr:hypothetical protein [Clostridiales bacterium]